MRYQPDPDAAGPSWLTFLGHAKDSLWRHAPSQVLRFGGQPDALIVSEAQPTRIEVLAEYAVFGLKIVDDLALLLVDPACERDNEEPEWVRQPA